MAGCDLLTCRNYSSDQVWLSNLNVFWLDHPMMVGSLLLVCFDCWNKVPLILLYFIYTRVGVGQ